jgi:hypothetical protein
MPLVALPTVTHAPAVVAVPAPFFWDAQTQQRIGSQATRFEVDGASDATALSPWYHLAYIEGGDHVRVHEHGAPMTRSPESDIAKSANVAWHVASALLGASADGARPAEIPVWARPRTGGSDGTSAGVVFALADLDLLTPGRLVGDLRVAGTGSIGSDGVLTAVRAVDAKLAAARLAHADVVFSPDFPVGSAPVTTVISHVGTDDGLRTIGEWLNMTAYERAGRRASLRSGELALVQVDDVRQALGWLCGRTDGRLVCAIARAAARTSVADARPYTVTRSLASPAGGGATVRGKSLPHGG